MGYTFLSEYLGLIWFLPEHYCADGRLKKYAQERKELLSEISKLKLELEEERIKSSGNCFGMMNGSDNEDLDES